MFDVFKSNPCVLVTVLAVCDFFGLMGYIIYCVKHSEKKKLLKKIIISTVCFVAVDVIFLACIISSNTFYDKNSNKYFNKNDVLYYDSDDTAYKITTDEKLRKYFVSTNGLTMYTAELVYIDKETGCIYYDRNGDISKKAEYIYTDKNGKEFYKTEDVKWNRQGEIHLNSK